MKRLLFILLLSFVFCTVYAQKRFSILGDSYSTYKGYVTPEKNLCFYRAVSKFPNDVHDVKDTWWWIIKEKLGYEMDTNNSYSGATICNTGYAKNDYTDRSFVTRMKDLGSPDILFVFGGTNDCWANSPLGEFQYDNWKKKDLYKFRPAFAYMLSYLKEHHPQARIINIINSELDGDYGTSMTEICKHYEVENIQLENIDKQYKHPSIEGMKEIARQVEIQLNAPLNDCPPEETDSLDSSNITSEASNNDSQPIIVVILIIGLLVSGLFGTVTLSNILAVCAMKFKKEAKLLREEGQLPKAESKASKAKVCKTAGIAFTVSSFLLLAELIYYVYTAVGHNIYELLFQ